MFITLEVSAPLGPSLLPAISGLPFPTNLLDTKASKDAIYALLRFGQASVECFYKGPSLSFFFGLSGKLT